MTPFSDLNDRFSYEAWMNDVATKPATLKEHVAEHEDIGCHDVSRSLGIQKMPDGYALMLNADHSHFYWLRSDGQESCIHWNKWAVYRWAKHDSLPANG